MFNNQHRTSSSTLSNSLCECAAKVRFSFHMSLAPLARYPLPPAYLAIFVHSPTFTLYTIHFTPQNRRILTISAILFVHIKKMLYICTAIPRRGCLHVIGWGSRHIKKAFIDALFWRFRNFATF